MERFKGINILDMNSIRSDVATHHDMREEWIKSKRCRKGAAPVVIKVESEIIETVAECLTRTPVGTVEATSDSMAPDSPPVEALIPDQRTDRWNKAVSKVAELVGKGIIPDYHSIALFEGLRRSDRRDITMQRVEVLYEKASNGKGRI